jgi:hypothetical protein
MATLDDVWPRIEQNAGGEFATVTGLRFTYRAPGQFIRVTRDGREINRVFSRTSFAKALARMPVSSPGQLNDLQGAAYVWAILMDRRIRQSDW